LLDRVREALFATLVPWLAGARILDLFAGSGSLGLEALSRGAASARLVERDPRAVRQLRANVAELGLAARVEVVVADALEAASWGEAASADVVFLDPPYALLEDPADRGRVLAAAASLVAETLRPEGVLVLHAPRESASSPRLPLPANRSRMRAPASHGTSVAKSASRTRSSNGRVPRPRGAPMRRPRSSPPMMRMTSRCGARYRREHGASPRDSPRDPRAIPRASARL